MKKSLEENLEKKFPLDYIIKEEEFKSIIKNTEIQEIVDDFYSLTKMGMAITDLKGNILISTGWQDICAKFHRVNEKSQKNCIESDLYLSKNIKPGNCSMYKCKNNMWDAVTPIIAGSEHVGNLFFGQFFFDDEIVDRKVFEDQAEKFGFDKEEYLAALDKVLRWSKTRIKTVMDFYVKFAQLISGLSLSNLNLAKALSDYKLAENEIKSASLYVRALIEASLDPLVTINPDGKITDVNNATEIATGLSRMELIGKDFSGYFTEPEEAKKGYEQVFLKGFVRDYPLTIKHVSGKTTDVLYNATIYKNEAGEVQGVFAAARDITEQKKVEEALYQEKIFIKAIFESIPGMLYVYDDKGNFIECNKKHEEMTGYSREELSHMNPLSWYDDEADIVRVKAAIKDVFTKGFGEVEAPMRIKNGKILLMHFTGSRLSMNGKEYFVGIGTDITEHKKAENEIFYISYHDQLTGLYNRRFFGEEIKRLNTKRQLPLSVVMGDLNSLKLTNDAFGHSEGDEALKKTAGLLKKICRSDDILARWGGDEFVILLPKTSTADSEEIVQRIKKECSKLIIQKLPLGLAIGIATKIEVAQDINEIIKEAESNMYRNKLIEKESYTSSIIFALERALYEKSNETMEHAIRIKDNVIELGKSIKLHSSQLDELALLASLHDIGKVAIPETILLKEGKLTGKEWAVIKRHPEIGFNISQASPQIVHVAKFIIACHENWDGSGYPQGLKGDAIPLLSRIIFIADAYDVMTSERVYKKAMSKDDAIKELRKCAGTQFDPVLIEKFIEILAN